jgi:RNA polymerase sigma-70 factor (ECF subfamily)
VTVDDAGLLAERFEENRARLRGVAYRMLGSPSEAEDAVQEVWLRLTRADAGAVDNLSGWLTTVVARVCLDMLRARKSRAEAPEPVVIRDDARNPEREALLADSVGLALMVVLEQLAPPERLAFVLHDLFGVSFEEIAEIVGRTPAAARQLASRARRRVQGAAAGTAPDLPRQREVVDAFLRAARGGDIDGLLAVLDPDIVLRSDRGAVAPATWREIRGAREIAEQAATNSKMAASVEPVLVNGAAGVLSRRPDGQPFAILAFTIVGSKIVEMDVISDPERLKRLAEQL